MLIIRDYGLEEERERERESSGKNEIDIFLLFLKDIQV